MSTLSFTTSGNATVQLKEGEKSILTTDPWLKGLAYFDSWALHHSYSDEEIASILSSEYLWISHGHPDHLHHESLELFKKGQKILIPDHFHNEIAVMLEEMGFNVQILKYRKWVRLNEKLEVCCLDNINQDAVLIMRFGDSLLINQNDSPLCGDKGFIQKLIKQHPNDKIFLFRLLGISADMLNYVDKNNTRVTEPPEAYKPGCIGEESLRAAELGARYFVCSSSQHQFVRSDSEWANSYDMNPDDLRKHWKAPSVEIIDPFAIVDLDTLEKRYTWPWQEPELALKHNTTGADNWEDTLSEEEWGRVTGFFSQFETLDDIADFIDIEVGGETRRIDLSKKGRERRGIRFAVPKQSLLETTEWGYFDDLLIGNFMKTELINMRLYPDFSPRLAKYAGNAKIKTKKQLSAFYRHYFWRNPIGFMLYMLDIYWYARVVRGMADWSERVGIKAPLKFIYVTLKRLRGAA